jgi:hypothetical protein
MTMEESRAVSLIGVYPDQRAAQRAASAAKRVGGDAVRVGSDADVRASLQAEMREEASEALIAPQVGVAYPSEAKRSIFLFGPLFVVAGAVLAMPFALIPIGDVSYWVRCFWYVVIGAAAGGAVAAITLPALSAKSGLEPNAAQRGVVVRIAPWSEDIEAAMAAAQPIRLDRIGPDDFPVGTVTTEEDHTEGGIAEEVRHNLVREVESPPEWRER